MGDRILGGKTGAEGDTVDRVCQETKQLLTQLAEATGSQR